MKPVTLDDVKKKDELVKKALAGKLVEKIAVGRPPKSQAARVSLFAFDSKPYYKFRPVQGRIDDLCTNGLTDVIGG